MPLRLRPPCDSEVEAVSDVHVEALPDLVDPSREFYTQVLGLVEEPGLVETQSNQGKTDGRNLCFAGQRHRLILKIRRAPRIDSVKRVALITVKSLDGVRETLDERRMPYVRLRSLGWASERVQVADPNGNLLELRQERLL